MRLEGVRVRLRVRRVRVRIRVRTILEFSGFGTPYGFGDQTSLKETARFMRLDLRIRA